MLARYLFAHTTTLRIKAAGMGEIQGEDIGIAECLANALLIDI